MYTYTSMAEETYVQIYVVVGVCGNGNNLLRKCLQVRNVWASRWQNAAVLEWMSISMKEIFRFDSFGTTYPASVPTCSSQQSAQPAVGNVSASPGVELMLSFGTDPDELHAYRLFNKKIIQSVQRRDFRTNKDTYQFYYPTPSIALGGTLSWISS